MKAVTWQKDSHGLFDYETKSLSVKRHRIESSCKIGRDGTNLIFIVDNDIIIQDIKNKEENQQSLTSI